MGSMKGQAAMEYLINYSWVLISVTIALSLILASGVFNPTGYNQDYCVGPSVVDCYNIYSEFNPTTNNGLIKLSLRNDFGFDIKINDIKLQDEKGNFLTPSGAIPSIWNAADIIILDFNTNSNTMDLGRLNRYEMSLEYSPCSRSGCSTNSYRITKTIYLSPQKKV